jgi:hypothetical protein
MNFVNRVVVKTLLVTGIIIFAGAPLLAGTLTVAQLAAAPTLDGSDSDWEGTLPTSIQLNKSSENVTVGTHSASIKAGVFGDEVYLFIQWEDSTKDDQHKPFVWDTAQNKYVAGDQKEDRLALQFEMKGDYTVNWMSGQSFTADMWHWKAARSNPLDLMQDKMTIIGVNPVKKAFKATGENGKALYIQRPSDQGDKFYTTKRYSSKENDMMPKYILASNPQGSIADVHCKGVWKDGKWNLEIQRKLNTSHQDDVVFAKGKSTKAGLAIFDHSGDDNHVISDTLTFQF